MKLITLNIWGGKIHDPLINFINKQKDSADIFTFQEIYNSDRSKITPNGSRSNILLELSKLLPDFKYFFSPAFHGRDFEHVVDYPLSQGLATFWRKDLNLMSKGAIFTHYKENDVRIFEETQKPDPPRLFQYLIFEKLLVINIHGYWEPRPKFDTPQRIHQSQAILDFIAQHKVPKVVAGDFNLTIDTQSIRLLEKKLRNLVREGGYTTTRSSLYDPEYKPYDKFADYIFTSADLPVFDFRVMKDEVSDHLPLSVVFDL